MKRSLLKQLVNEYHPTDKHEIVFKQNLLEFLEKHEDCFERSLTCGHITGSAWLLSRDYSQALLMHHTKLDRWFQLGGHCDGDHDVLGVALKEAQEESGINAIVPVETAIFDIDIHKIPGTEKIPEHYHYDVRFLLTVESEEEVIQNKESKELRWISKDLDQLPTDNPSVVRMFKKWIALNL